MKKVLITGANSFIGSSFEKYAAEHYPNELSVDTVDMIDGTWRQKDFSSYDIVFHVAGIAHADVGQVDEATKKKYYAINTELTIETARKAKTDGVNQFIFMSSAIIYGDSAPYWKKKIITRETEPAPSNFYGDSKWQADKGVRALADENFTVTVLRPPMIYGKGSKGNYPILAKMANRMPVFPDVENERSMLFIDNLCEFLCQIMIRGCGGIYWPQNAEYTRTSEMVRMIAEANGHKIIVSKVFNWIVTFAAFIPGKTRGLANKAFGNLSYEKGMSNYEFEYQKVGFKESIKRTEKNGKKALILVSVASMIDQFNIPNIQILQSLCYKVDVAADFTHPGTITVERAKDLKQRLNDMDVRVFDIPIPRSLNLSAISTAYRKVKKLITSESYNLIHCQSPIGGVICRQAARNERKKGTQVIYTAHGFHFYDGAPIQNWILYYPVEKFFSRWTDVLISINKEDYKRASESFHAKKIVYMHGVGVDNNKFKNCKENRKEKRREIGVKETDFVLLSVGELTVRKNHAVVLDALGKLKRQNQIAGIRYIICGLGKLEDELKEKAIALGISEHVIFEGYRTDLSEIYNAADAFVFPSLQEGLPVALMEAMACGLPVICSDIRGNTDLVENEKNGLVIENTPDSLVKAIGIFKNNPDICSKYAQNAINRIKDFDLTLVKNEILEIYETAEIDITGGAINTYCVSQADKEK